MKIIETAGYTKMTEAKKKGKGFSYKGEHFDTNPFAVCNKNISKKDSPAKWERCVQHVKHDSKD